MFGIEGSYQPRGFLLLLAGVEITFGVAIICRNYQIPEPIVDFREQRTKNYSCPKALDGAGRAIRRNGIYQ